MRESTLESQIRKYAISKGMLVRKFVTPGHTGSPDRMLITRGGTVWFMEVKRPGEMPTPLQLREHRVYQDRGVRCVWVDSVFFGKYWIDQMEKQ